MKIHISAQGLELTPSIKIYIEKKLAPLSRFIKGLDEKGTAEMLVEVGRLTRHHRHGRVYRVVAGLRLPPKKLLRAEERTEDLRAGIDAVKDKLAREIRKHKTRFAPARRRGK